VVNDFGRPASEGCGRIDILVNNAGILRDMKLRQMTLDDSCAVVALHRTGAQQTVRVGGIAQVHNEVAQAMAAAR